MIEKFIAELLRRYSISLELQVVIATEKEIKMVKRKDKLSRPGAIPGNLYLVVEGIFRHYTVIEGNECTSRFIKAGDFLTPAKFLMDQAPFTDGMEALTDGCLVYIPYSSLERLEKIPGYVEFRKQLTQDHFMGQEKRSYYLNYTNNKDRFFAFLKREPGFFGKVPDHLVASYLGMTATHLSRIKKKHKAEIDNICNEHSSTPLHLSN